MDPHGQPGPVDRDLAAHEAVELTVLARRAGVKLVHVRRYLEFGLFEPHRVAAVGAQRFDPSDAARVARAERLRRDLNLNYAGAVLVCELLDRISELEARLH
ncbi:MAG TPA: chaperone modulator CbpM [Solirubrobacteraceae bacterium]|nr:chaperone modulator CbpM [Solirubrobacteraceae bacterium]